jgi:hypothetical protein
MHVPVMHVWPEPHVLPHPPQLLTSVPITLMHDPLHSVRPLGHMHVPLLQTWPELHVLLHPPQLLTSLPITLMHDPPH